MNNISPTRDQVLKAADNARRAGRLEEEKQLLKYAAEIGSFQEEIVAGNTTKQVSIPTMGQNGMVSSAVVSVPKYPDEMAAARARNAQAALGLSEPIAPPTEGGLTLGQRSFASRAPTQKDLENYFRLEFGDGNFVSLGSDKFLVKRDGAWYLSDPVGLELGDVADLVGYGPQLASAAAASIALAPGPVGSVGKLAKASGIPAAASAIAGGLQDIYFRFATDQPINPGEIAARRGMEAATEFAFGMALPAVAGKVANIASERAGVKSVYKNFDQEAQQALNNLREAGVNPATSFDLGQTIRELSPSKKSAYDMGLKIAQLVDAEDKKLATEATRAASRAGLDASDRARSLIDSAVPPTSYTIDEVGSAAVTAAQTEFNKTRTSLQALFDSAMDDISRAVSVSGSNKEFVTLGNTRKVLSDLRKGSLRKFKDLTEEEKLLSKEELELRKIFGESVPGTETERIPMSSEIEGLMGRLSSASKTPQSLMAARAERTRLGEYISGSTPLPAGMSMGFARALYKSLSQDIDESVAKLTGPGSDKLKQYNTLYRSMMEPVENNTFVSRLVNGGFENPEEVVNAFSRAGTNDWNLTKGILPPRTFDYLKRSVVDKMRNDSTVELFGKKVIDVPQLVSRMNNMGSDTVRNELFGGKKTVDTLRRISDEYSFLSEKGGLFTRQSLPSMDEIEAVVDEAQRKGVDAANVYFNQAINATKARRNALGSSLVSLARDGNFNIIAKDPEAVFDAVVFNPGINGIDVKKFVASLPRKVRTDMGDTAFQTVFANARNVAESSTRGTRDVYDVNAVIQKAFGDKARVEAMTALVGTKRMDMLRDWIAWETKLAIDMKKKGFKSRNIANLVATAPYPNLFAARAASMGLESIAGLEFIKGANPLNVVAFPRARQAFLRPTKTSADIALIQQAINIGGKEMFDKYNEMMNQLTPEQEAAAAQYLFGGRD